MQNELLQQVQINANFSEWIASFAPVLVLGGSFVVAVSIVWAGVAFLRNGFAEVDQPEWKLQGDDLRDMANDEANWLKYEKSRQGRLSLPISQLHLDTNSEWEADPDGDDSD